MTVPVVNMSKTVRDRRIPQSSALGQCMHSHIQKDHSSRYHFQEENGAAANNTVSLLTISYHLVLLLFWKSGGWGGGGERATK